MIWRTFLLCPLCVITGLLQEKVSLTPASNDVFENDSLELTCHTNTSVSQWGIQDRTNFASFLTFSEEGQCMVDGFLTDIEYFDTKCYGNNTHTVIIKHVNTSNHGQKWYCLDDKSQSNIAYINVQVPIKHLTFTNFAGGFIKTVENTSTTLTCKTSEGRPAANVTWTKISKTGDLKYYVPKNERITVRNLTIVTSSIDIYPFREDDGSRIICEATNKKSHSVREEINIYVEYPPSKPTFIVNEENVNGNECFIPDRNVSILCKSYSNPPPTYIWNTTFRSLFGQYLNLSTIVGSETWQCIATNNMSLPNNTKTAGVSYAMLTIHHLYTPKQSPDFDLKTNISGEQDETITFQFKAVAQPKLFFQWFKLSGSTWNNLENNSKYQINTTDYYSALTIRRITDDEYGCYNLTIQNAVGTLHKLYFLKGSDSVSLNVNPLKGWILVAYTAGGVIVLLVLFGAAFVSTKRCLKRKSTNVQSVPVSETDNSLAHLHSNTQNSVNERRNASTTNVKNASRIIADKTKQNRIYVSQHQEGLQLEQFSEPTEYCNSLDVINKLGKMEATELYDYIIDRTDESFRVDFEEIPTRFEKTCSFARKQLKLERNDSLIKIE